MPRPEPAEYNQAIQNPRLSFDDPELKLGQPELDSLGLPRAVSGSFASVYQLHCGRRDWAVRCFLREFADQEQRYREIDRHLSTADLAYTVGFKFLPKGIRVRGQWYPVLKMEWVRGDPLNVYVQKHLRDPSSLRGLADRWLEMMRVLNRAGIAHGDLQHGNVMVVNGEPRLIDYDGMFVPTLTGLRSHEIGHRNYQHPNRGEVHFGPYLDNFAAWVIYLSLLALSVDPGLGDGISTDSEHLLLRREDFERPNVSKTFQALEQMQDRKIHVLASLIRSFVSMDMSQLPAIQGNPVPASIPKAVRPSWLEDYVPAQPRTGAVAVVLAPAIGASAWVVDQLRPAPTVRVTASPVPERRLCIAFLVLVALLIAIVLGGLMPPTLAGAFAGCALALVLLVFTVRYLSLPEASRKIAVWADVKRAELAAGRAEESISELAEQRDELCREGHKQLDALAAKQRTCEQREQEEIGKVDRDLQGALARLNAEGEALWQEQREEIERAVRDIQCRFVDGELAGYSLSGARIPGIGPQLKSRLAADGIRTARDIVDIHVIRIPRGRQANDIAHVEVAGRGRIRIEALGLTKAQGLWEWRQSVESAARTRMPRSLPAGQVARISSPYRARRQHLDDQRLDALQSFPAKKDSVRHRYGRERDGLARQMKAARSGFARRRQELDLKVAEASKTLAQKQWALAVARQELVSYRQVTFRKYLRHIP